MEEKDFVKKYNWGATKIVTVVNPRAEDFEFGATIEAGLDAETGRLRSETRTYVVRAGKSERLPAVVARLYLDQMSKLLAQDDDQISRIIDFSVRDQYYQSLIVDVIDVVDNYQPLPQYMDQTAVKQEEPEVAFAGKDQVDGVNEETRTDDSADQSRVGKATRSSKSRA